jgi:hypothetical protein
VAAEIDCPGESRSTNEAVARETPLAAATSFSVTRGFGPATVTSAPTSSEQPQAKVLPNLPGTIKVRAKSIY